MLSEKMNFNKTWN